VKFYRNKKIEDLAERRLAELEQKLGQPVLPPIPMDAVGEQILGLNFLWEEIEELPGEIIFGALNPKARLVILNESRRAIFEDKPGLERSTKGHELGHWDLFIDKTSLDHPTLPGFDEGAFVRRRSGIGEVEVLKILKSCQEGEKLLSEIEARADEPDEARAVNRYAAALSMPESMIRAAAAKIDRTKWPPLYQLARKFDVTISALRVRLEQLGLLYLDKDGRLYESRDQAVGQASFGF